MLINKFEMNAIKRFKIYAMFTSVRVLCYDHIKRMRVTDFIAQFNEVN